MDVLLSTTIEGIPPGMPPRGLCQECTDEQLKDAISFMLSANP
jgi:cytochrome c5